MVNRENGIIRSISELPRQAYSPSFFYFKASVSNTIIFNENDNLGITAGTSRNRSKAIVKALGEGIERYCAGSYHTDELIFSSYQNLTVSALHPDYFQLYLEEQFSNKDFPLKKFAVDTKMFWIKSINGITNEIKYVPAAYVYCPFVPNANNINNVEAISTGLAAHCSFEEASLNGFLEVVERNNFMFTWLTESKPLSVERSSLTKEHEDLILLYERYGYKVSLSYNTGRDGIPSFIALIRGTRKYNVPLLIAAATHLDPSQAITKCLEEIALMERLCQQQLLKPSVLATTADYSKVNGLLDHIMLWFNPKVWKHADFLMSKERTVSLTDIPNLFKNNPKEDLIFIINSIERLGYQTLISDITPKDISSLGLSAVRALVPAYIPLNKSFLCRPLGAKYLKDYFSKKGIKGTDITNHINSVPHPFA